MNIHLILLSVFLVLVGVAVIVIMMAKCGFLKCLLCSAASGVGALLALHFTSLMTGFSVVLNPISLAAGVIGGLPAVAGMAVLQFLF